MGTEGGERKKEEGEKMRRWEGERENEIFAVVGTIRQLPTIDDRPSPTYLTLDTLKANPWIPDLEP